MITIDEQARRKFEEDWLQGQPESIRRYLPPEASASYLGTLEELVCIDLEFRWKPGEGDLSESNNTISANQATIPTRVEDYLREFPELRDEQIVQRLIEQEIHVRLNSGYIVEPSEYQSRFPEVTIDESLFSSPGDGETIVQGAAETATHSSQFSDFPTTFGNYRLLGLLGKGGMGSVYRARQEAAGREVALKIAELDNLSPRGRSLMIQRFQSEAITASKVAHDHIVPVYDVGVVDGNYFIAMQLVQGGDLSSMSKAEPLASKRAAKYLLGVAQALAAAHETGMLHRDIKPGNILVDSTTDRALLTDFGLARFEQEDSGMTQTGQLLGTPSFMPPEQIKNSSDIDARADIYALGGTLYQLLTGKPPFKASDMHETLRQVLADDVAGPRQLNSTVDRDLETICLKCLEKAPEARYQMAQELADDLHRYLQGRPILAKPVGPLRRLQKWCKRNPALATAQGLAMAGGLATILATSIGWYTTDQAWQAEASQRIQTEKERKNAVLARNEFQSSVRNLYIRFRDEPMLATPGLEHVKQDFLQDTKQRFERFVASFQDDPTLLEDRAFALAAIAEMNADLQPGASATVESIRQALTALGELDESSKSNPNMLEAESNMRLAEGRLSLMARKTSDALLSFQKCSQLRQRWTAAMPESFEAKRKLANSLMNEGVAHSQAAQVAALNNDLPSAERALTLAEQRYMDAQTIRRQLLDDEQVPESTDLRVRRDYAKAEFNLSYMELRNGDLEAAGAYLQTASDMFGALASEVVNDNRLWRDYARARISLADVSVANPANSSENVLENAAELVSSALQDLRALAMLRSNQPLSQLGLIAEYQRGLEALLSMNHLDLAEGYLRELESLMQASDLLHAIDSTTQPTEQVLVLLNLAKLGAFVAEGLSDPEEAKRKIERAVSVFEEQQQLVAADPMLANDLQLLHEALAATEAKLRENRP